MRRRLAVGGVLAALLVSIVAAMPGASAAQSGAAGNYIVVLKGTAGSPGTLASQHASRYGAKVGHVYRHALKGYSASLSSTRLAALRADPNVAAVVADLPVHTFAQTLPTGINRIDGELSSTVSGNGSGDVNVDIAIIDTGIGPNTDLNVVGGSTASAVPASTTTTATAPTWPASPPPATTPTASSASPQGHASTPSRC